MSATVAAVVAACAAIPPAVTFGCTIGVLVGAWWQRRQDRLRRIGVDEGAAIMTDEDREILAAEFAAHTEAVTDQVTEYADALASGDPVLRARLRELEQHSRRKD